MAECKYCNKKFKQMSHYYRHNRESFLCKKIKEKNEENEKLQEEITELKKYKIKYTKIKTISKIILTEKITIEKENQELEKRLKNKFDDVSQKMTKKLERRDKKIYELKNKLKLSETRVKEKQQAAEMIVEASKNNSKPNTVINNNIVIQDFRIIQAKEFADKDLIDLTNEIRENGIDKVCQYIMKKHYWSIPPNIMVKDQARKKINVVKDNKWVQENWDTLVRDLYYKCFQKIAFRCIDKQIEYHEDYLDNIESFSDTEEIDKHKYGLELWKCNRELWNNFKVKDLSHPLIVSIKNAQDRMIEVQ